MKVRVGDAQELTASEGNPEEREGGDGEPRYGSQPWAQGVRGTPSQSSTEQEDGGPAGQHPGESRNGIQEEVDGQPPKGGTDDEALGQGQAVVSLPQRDAGNDEAYGGKCEELGRQDEQSRDDFRVDAHLRALTGGDWLCRHPWADTSLRARVLITAMGGQLTAAGTPGEGSTFRIELPVADGSR